MTVSLRATTNWAAVLNSGHALLITSVCPSSEYSGVSEPDGSQVIFPLSDKLRKPRRYSSVRAWPDKVSVPASTSHTASDTDGFVSSNSERSTMPPVEHSAASASFCWIALRNFAIIALE